MNDQSASEQPEPSVEDELRKAAEQGGVTYDEVLSEWRRQRARIRQELRAKAFEKARSLASKGLRRPPLW